MLEKIEEAAEEKAMVQFLSKFDEYPFLIKFQENEYPVGEGKPVFTVNVKSPYRQRI